MTSWGGFIADTQINQYRYRKGAFDEKHTRVKKINMVALCTKKTAASNRSKMIIIREDDSQKSYLFQ